MLYVLTIILSCTVVGTYLASGARWAIAVAWASAMVLPAWLCQYMGAVLVTPQIICSLLALAVFIAEGKWRGSWAWSDLLVAALALTQVTSYYLNDEFTPTMIAGAITRWVLPYAFGRIALQSLEDLDRMTTASSWTCLILAVWAMVESITRVNPVAMLSSYTGSDQSNLDVRWGLRRVEGPTFHPIFFGLLLVLLMPWALAAARRARLGTGPRWWALLPWLVGIAAFLTMSRGPQLAMLLTLLITLFCRFPAWRKVMATAAVASLGLLLVGSSFLIGALHAWSNERADDMSKVSIQGELYDYSGTNHRLLQLKVYEQSALEAGWFGFGETLMLTHPEDLPKLEPHLVQQFSSIDNHYLMFLLATGYVGLFLFLALCAVSLLQWAPAAFDCRNPASFIAAGLFGAATAVIILMMTVYFAVDFGYFWLFTAGLSGSLAYCERIQAAPRRLLGRLTPGHPVLPHPATT